MIDKRQKTNDKRKYPCKDGLYGRLKGERQKKKNPVKTAFMAVSKAKY